MSYDKRGTLIGGIVAACALPESSVTSFLAVENEFIGEEMGRILIMPTSQQFMQLIRQLVGDEQMQVDLIAELINFGNALDLKAHMKMIIDHGQADQQPGIKEWLSVCDRVLTAIASVNVQATAIYIYAQPFDQQSGASRQQAIESTKAVLNLPSQVDFDALLYKMAPRGVTYLAVQDPVIRSRLSGIDVGVLTQAEKKIKTVLKEQLRLSRDTRKQTAMSNNMALGEAGQGGVMEEDFEVTDYTITLESHLAGVLQSSRGIKIEQMGDSELANYVLLNQQAYRQGIIPGAISPGKISGCQDIVTMTVLQDSILTLAEQQIFELSTATVNPNVRAGLKQLGQTPQAASLKAKADIVQQTQLYSMASFATEPYNKAADLKYQISGGPNDLKDDLQMAQHRNVLRLNPYEVELLGQSLSAMLACIRIRFNATQNSKGELVSQEDIDSLQMIHRLSSYLPPDSLRFFDEITTYLATLIADGHNRQLVIGYGLNEEDMADAIAGAFEQGKEIAKTVPMFQQDLAGLGSASIYKEFFEMVLLSLANRNRMTRETTRRLIHRNAIFNAVEGKGQNELEVNQQEPMSMQKNEEMMNIDGQQEQEQVQKGTVQMLNN